LAHKTVTVSLHNLPRNFNDAAIAAGIGIPFTGTNFKPSSPIGVKRAAQANHPAVEAVGGDHDPMAC
jgi:hypothetical protein